MKARTHSAFTLIELLIVISIVAILAGIVLPIYGSVQMTARRTQSLSNMRQFGTALIAYCGDNNGQLPTEGSSNPSWGTAGNTTLSATEATAWYNVLPRSYANSRGVADYTSSTAADFYSKNSLFYVPAAKYPSTKLSAPQFAMNFCSKLFDSTFVPEDSLVRLPNFQAPAETVVFQESGLPGEKVIRGQSAYTNQSKSYASRSVARYGGNTIITFADGHADVVLGTDIVASNGKSYTPQISQNGGKVYWTMNPTVDASK